MKILLTGLLALIARASISLLGGVGYFLGLLLSKNKAKYNLNVAISYDQLGNVILAPLMNVLLKKKGGKFFGHPDETISFVLGRNKALGKLTKLGKLIADGLNKIDPNHVEKAKS